MFEWDRWKAEANAAKHGVTFTEAVTIFLDTEALDGSGLAYSTAEPRFRRLGRSVEGRVLIAVDSLRSTGHAETIRLISPGRASRRECAADAAQD